MHKIHDQNSHTIVKFVDLSSGKFESLSEIDINSLNSVGLLQEVQNLFEKACSTKAFEDYLEKHRAHYNYSSYCGSCITWTMLISIIGIPCFCHRVSMLQKTEVEYKIQREAWLVQVKSLISQFQQKYPNSYQIYLDFRLTGDPNGMRPKRLAFNITVKQPNSVENQVLEARKQALEENIQL